MSLIPCGQLVRQIAEGRGIFQQRRNIVEENAGLGEIRHFADESLIVDTETPALEQVGLRHGLSLDGAPKPD